MNSTLTTVINPNDPNQQSGLPGYAIAILVIGLIVITVIVVFLLLRGYRKYSEKRARMDVQNAGINEIVAERRRLFSAPESL
jgi:hypothetical protein